MALSLGVLWAGKTYVGATGGDGGTDGDRYQTSRKESLKCPVVRAVRLVRSGEGGGVVDSAGKDGWGWCQLMIILADGVAMAMSLHFFLPSFPQPPCSSSSLAHNHLLRHFPQTLPNRRPILLRVSAPPITSPLNRPPPPNYTA